MKPFVTHDPYDIMPRMIMKILRDRRLLYATMAVLSFILAARASEDISRHNFKDFASYLEGGRALRNGTPLYFDQEDPSFRYSPFFALLMAPLTFIDERAAYAIWITIMLVQLFCILPWARSTVDQENFRTHPPSLWLYIPAIFLTTNFTFTNFDKGQANIFVLFWVMAAWILSEKKHAAAAGFCLSIGILAKMSPVVFFPFLLFRKKYKLLLWCGVGLVVLSLLPWLLQEPAAGWKTLNDWFLWTREGHNPYFLSSQSNQSLVGAIHRLFTKQTTTYMIETGFGDLQIPLWGVKAVYLALSAMIYGAFLLKPNEKRLADSCGLKPEGVDFVGILTAITIIFPVGWKYCLVPFLVSTMTVLLYLFRVKGRDKTVLIFLSLFLLLATLIPSTPDRLLRVKVHYHSVVTWGGLFLAAALLKIKHLPSRIASVPS